MGVHFRGAVPTIFLTLVLGRVGLLLLDGIIPPPILPTTSSTLTLYL